MPTGYTHPIADGKITDFRDFALSCARAFGALVMMREDAPDAEIPDEFKPDDHHEKELVKARQELARIEALSPEMALSESGLSHHNAVGEWTKSEADKLVKRRRYQAVLDAVNAWKPPTDEHKGLHEFMREQITKSIEWDCEPSKQPEPVSVNAWWAEEKRRAAWSVKYYTDEAQKEIARAKYRTNWVRALKASLV